MKKISSLILLFILSINQVAFAAPNAIGVTHKTFKINNQNKTVNVVSVDLNSSDIELGVAVANDKIGTSEDFSSMVKRKNAVAAINANYFDAYKTLEPIGAIMVDKEFKHIEGDATSMLISNKKNVGIGNHRIRINGYLDGFKSNQWNNETKTTDFHLFDIWLVNKIPTDPKGVYLYTSARGNEIKLNGGIAIEVINNKVTKITKTASQSIIPKDGYIIYYGKDKSFESYVDARFKVGKTVELEYNISEIKKEKAKNLSSKQTKLFGSINGQTENRWSREKDKMEFNTFNVWLINSESTDSSGVYLYTPERGSSVQVNLGHAVIVEDGIISKIAFDIKEITIPKNGFAIYYGKDSVDKEYLTKRFNLGSTIDFYHKETLKPDTENIIKKAVKDNNIALTESLLISEKKSNPEGMISAGPYLVEDGKVIFDPNNSGFKEDKIIKNRAQRSAVGITANNKLLLVTGSNLNMQELAQIMIELGATRAMNVDGGASSGLYAKGNVITKPGRNLHTVLMIYDKSVKEYIVNN